MRRNCRSGEDGRPCCISFTMGCRTEFSPEQIAKLEEEERAEQRRREEVSKVAAAAVKDGCDRRGADGEAAETVGLEVQQQGQPQQPQQQPLQEQQHGASLRDHQRQQQHQKRVALRQRQTHGSPVRHQILEDSSAIPPAAEAKKQTPGACVHKGSGPSAVVTGTGAARPTATSRPPVVANVRAAAPQPAGGNGIHRSKRNIIEVDDDDDSLPTGDGKHRNASSKASSPRASAVAAKTAAAAAVSVASPPSSEGKACGKQVQRKAPGSSPEASTATLKRTSTCITGVATPVRGVSTARQSPPEAPAPRRSGRLARMRAN